MAATLCASPPAAAGQGEGIGVSDSFDEACLDLAPERARVGQGRGDMADSEHHIRQMAVAANMVARLRAENLSKQQALQVARLLQEEIEKRYPEEPTKPRE
jgi:hypothetical protein